VPAAFRERVQARAVEAYAGKEAEFPVLAGLYRFTARDVQGHKRYERDQLITWAAARFDAKFDVEALRNKQPDEIRQIISELSRKHQAKAGDARTEVARRLDRLFGPDAAPGATAGSVSGRNGTLQSLADYVSNDLGMEMTVDELARHDRAELELRLNSAIDERFRPEMHRMERTLVLQILDAAWKEHLLAMDHLKHSVGLRGYAQVDPKVEFKREGMRIFDQMWHSVGERVTDLVFRMEQLDENWVGSLWVEQQAIHEEAQPTSEIAQQQQAAIDQSQSDKKPEPIRNRQQRVGRNDPCPCGSGKKFKNCCMRQGAAGRPL